MWGELPGVDYPWREKLGGKLTLEGDLLIAI